MVEIYSKVYDREMGLKCASVRYFAAEGEC